MTPGATTVLLVHDHPIAGEMIHSFIQTHKPFWNILRADTPEEALVHLKKEHIHLVIADLQTIPVQDSFTFLAMLNGWNPPIPVIVIDKELPEEVAGLAGGITVLQEPVDFDVLLELLDTMTLAAQESVLNGVSLRVFLQMLELEHKTCTLRIVSGYQMGHLYLRRGRLISARTGPLQDQPAALSILDWPNCTISISEGASVSETMDLSIQTLLMEWCINRDENEQPPPPARREKATH